MCNPRASRRICVKATGLLIFLIANVHVIQVGGFTSVSPSALLAERVSAQSARRCGHGAPSNRPSATCVHSLCRAPAFQPFDAGLGRQATPTSYGLRQSRLAQRITLRLSASDSTEEQPGKSGVEAKEAGGVEHGDAEEDNARSYRSMFGDVIPAWLIDRLETLGFTEPTPVQEEAIQVIMKEERDALVQSYTGSGKTLAFLIPLLASLEINKSKGQGHGKKERRLAGVQAVIVAPTRELAMQLTKVARQLASACPDATLHVMALSSDGKAARQRTWLKADPPQVVVGDPDSLLKVTEAGTLRTGSVRFLVVDEVDACLGSSQTKQALNRLLSRLLTSRKATSDVEKRRTVFASATVNMHQHFLQVCEKNKWMLRPKHVHVEAELLVPPQLTHSFLPLAQPDRVPALLALLQAPHLKVVLVFADPSRPAWEPLLQALEGSVGPERLMVLDGPAAKRVRGMARFRDQEGFKVMVASDLAARGVDVPEISHVVNFDMPLDWEMYCHRAGRAARNQRQGEVISLLGEGEVFVLERFANALSVSMHQLAPDGRRLQGQAARLLGYKSNSEHHHPGHSDSEDDEDEESVDGA